MSDHAIITIDTNISKKGPPLTTKLIRDNSKLTKEKHAVQLQRTNNRGSVGAKSHI